MINKTHREHFNADINFKTICVCTRCCCRPRFLLHSAVFCCTAQLSVLKDFSRSHNWNYVQKILILQVKIRQRSIQKARTA